MNYALLNNLDHMRDKHPIHTTISTDALRVLERYEKELAPRILFLNVHFLVWINFVSKRNDTKHKPDNKKGKVGNQVWITYRKWYSRSFVL